MWLVFSQLLSFANFNPEMRIPSLCTVLAVNSSLHSPKTHFSINCLLILHLAVPVVQQTWGPDAGSGIAYYSEVEDEQFGTTDIGVPNTERGMAAYVYVSSTSWVRIPPEQLFFL